MAKKAAASTKKADHVKAVFDAINKALGKGSVTLLREGLQIQSVEHVIPTGVEVIDNFLFSIGGLPAGRIVELFSEEGGGKAQPVGTPTLTPHGWVKMGDLKVGDEVIGVDGQAQRVEGVFPQGVKQTYTLQFSDKTEAIACGEHLWETWTYSDEARGHKPRVMRTAEFLEVALQNGMGNNLWRFPIVAPVEFAPKDLPLDPYLLGVLLGDGCLTRGADIANSSDEMYQKVVAALPINDTASFNGTSIRIRRAERINSLDGSPIPSVTRFALKALGLFGCRAESKFIPRVYLYGSVPQRIALLQGLLDTDGHATKHHVDYSTVSEELAIGVAHLVRSLGGLATISVKASPKYAYKGEVRIGQKSWRVGVRVPNLEVVTLKKHLNRYSPPQRVIRHLVSVKPFEKQECVCIKVSSARGLYVTDNFIVTHNTSLGYTFLAAAQRAGGLAALWDSEQSFDPERAQLFGVDTNDLLLAQPDHIEELLEGVDVFLRTLEAEKDVGPSVIVWDSIAAASTKAEFEEGFDTKEHAAKKAAALSRAMRIIGPRIKRSKVCMVCINQLREKVGVVFGNKDTTPGGKAVKFHASLRLQLLGGKAVKDNKTNDHIAKVITFLVVKSRFSPPYRKALVRLDYASGWNNAWTTLSHAKDRGVIAKDTKMSTKAYKESVAALGWDIPENVEVANALLDETETTEASE